MTAWENAVTVKMSLSKEQLKHDRINLSRLVKRLEHVVSDDCWTERDHWNREDVWVKAQGMAQVRDSSMMNVSLLTYPYALSENSIR